MARRAFNTTFNLIHSRALLLLVSLLPRRKARPRSTSLQRARTLTKMIAAFMVMVLRCCCCYC